MDEAVAALAEWVGRTGESYVRTGRTRVEPPAGREDPLSVPPPGTSPVPSGHEAGPAARRSHEERGRG